MALAKKLKMKQKTKRNISRNVIRHFSACLLGNLLTDKSTIKAGENAIRPGQNF